MSYKEKLFESISNINNIKKKWGLIEVLIIKNIQSKPKMLILLSSRMYRYKNKAIHQST